MKAASRIMLVAALMISIGLHWAVMQSVAWVGMAVTYTVKTGSVVQGLSDTFDGEHACPMCHAVEKGTKNSSPKQDDSLPGKVAKDMKLHLALISVPAFIFAAPVANKWTAQSETGSSRSITPEPPPPRRGLEA